MLVTLGTNQALSANASSTLPYACKSVQKVFVKIDDSTGSTAYDHRLTIQLGSRVICNGVSAWGLWGFSILNGGDNTNSSSISYQIDLGSHNLLDNENLYVTVQAGAAALDAVDVSALVDEPVGEFPVRYTEYTDNVFTAENVLSAISYDSARQVVDEDGYNIEIRDAVNSSSPSLISACNWYGTQQQTGNTTLSQSFGLLVRSTYPLTTTFNYPSSAVTDSILCASQMGTSARAVKQAKRQQRIVKSQIGK